MKPYAFVAALFASAALGGPAAATSTNQTNFTFDMVPACASVKASGRVTITHTPQLEENMHVEATGLPPNTDFHLFVIQDPIKPFALAWYMGDMLTDGTGSAVADFIGRFNIGTFIVAPGTTPAPVVLPGDASSNPPTPPVQLYHLGLWFDTPSAAAKVGCGDKETPFNSTHNAGAQVLNTSNFLPGNGPLFFVHP
ncbi:MAG TPA: hypothetical protein VME69_02620 [Methylocella sp.]|nr:hypothetical protein [Methylocella sp.]